MAAKDKVQGLYDKLINADKVPFPPPRGSIEAPTKHGVYVISSPRGQVLHVGRTERGRNGLKQRLQNHLHGSSSFAKGYSKPKKLNLRRGYYYRYVVVSNPKLRAYVEGYATGMLKPAHIGTGT